MENTVKTLILLLALISINANAQGSVVEGHWFFYKKIYQNQEIPEPPGATLRMHFEFSAKGESTLYWWHEGEKDLCRRKGIYSVEEDQIVDEVTWVDPKNSYHCVQDPDMQLGRRTRTPFYFRGGDLAIRFHLGDESLDLVWKKIKGEGK